MDGSQVPSPPEREHSALGASGAARWLACPGSVGLSQTAPPRRASRYAAAGTLAHALLETALRGNIPDLRIGDNVKMPSGHIVEFTEDMFDGIGLIIEYIRNQLRAMGKPKDKGSGGLFVEQLVCLDEYWPPDARPPISLFGTADVLLVDIKRQSLEVIDFKSGSGVLVEVRGNPQLLYYAAGALRVWNKNNPRHPITSVTLTVGQPHAIGQDKIRSITLTSQDIEGWVEAVLKPGVARCFELDPPLQDGPHCRFCPAAMICPLLERAAQRAARQEFEDSTAGNVGFDDSRMPELLEVASRAETWVTAVQQHAFGMLQAGQTIKDWALVPTRPQRHWTDPHVAEVLCQNAGINDAMKLELRSPAQIQKLVMKRVPELWARLETLIERRSSGLKLHRVGDPAPEDDVH